jgi:IclR family acetate operon transcriptional repressor
MKALLVSDSQPIQSLGRVLDVLSLFDSERSELSLSEIAELLEWPVPTTHRATAALAERGYLSRDRRTKLFRLGFEVVRLAASMIAGFQLPDLARPYLHALTEETGETASLAILDGGEVFFLASSAGRFRLRVEVTPGQRSPAHCTALGKCLLAQLDPDEARLRLGPEPYRRETPRSACTWAELAPRLAKARADGYALSVDEYEEGLSSCAVPVQTRDGVIAAMNVAAPALRVAPAVLVEVVAAKLQAAAAAIGRAQGHP